MLNMRASLPKELPVLRKIISGGQTGADMGGLLAAQKCGIETGGWIPKGFQTENGLKPDLADFGLKETTSVSYTPRTKYNVEDSDGTIRFAGNFASPGEICTRRAILANRKECIDVDFNNPTSPEKVAAWIKDKKIEVLNVAGNRESKCPGIEKFTEEFLSTVFKLLGEEENGG